MFLPWVTSTFNTIFKISKKIEADNVVKYLAFMTLSSSPNTLKSSIKGSNMNEDS